MKQERYQEKFIVINRKRFKEINDAKGMPDGKTHVSIKRFLFALEQFIEDYQRITGEKMDQKYYVCNQDEPYADIVLGLIL